MLSPYISHAPCYIRNYCFNCYIRRAKANEVANQLGEEENARKASVFFIETVRVGHKISEAVYITKKEFGTKISFELYLSSGVCNIEFG